MDTGATDHVHANAGILNSIFDKYDTHSLFVGNGSQMPVVTTGHTPFPRKIIIVRYIFITYLSLMPLLNIHFIFINSTVKVKHLLSLIVLVLQLKTTRPDAL